VRQDFFMLKIYDTNTHPLSQNDFSKLYEIVIKAYALTEKEVWGENYIRIKPEEYKSYCDNNEILYACLEGEIVGGVRFLKLKDTTWSFSLLGADFSKKGRGIGRALIAELEKRVLEKGGERIHIEILRAKNINVESKKILGDWYQRLGYDFIKTIDVFEVYNDAQKWAKLANPSLFDCYLKVL
jgi:GNAT superfamily N-acetyltransferase